MAASAKSKPSIFDRLTGKHSAHNQAGRTAVVAKLDLRRAEMQNAARFRAWKLATALANEQPVSIDEAAVIMAEAGIDQAGLDQLVEMIRDRSKHATYKALSEQNFQNFRDAKQEERKHEADKKAAIAHYDKLAKEARISAGKFHHDAQHYQDLASRAGGEIPLLAQILDAVREENRRLRGSVSSVEDQLAAAQAVADGAKQPVAEHLAAFILYIDQHGVPGDQLERRNNDIATVLDEIKAARLADCRIDKIEAWTPDDWKQSRIEEARREVRVFLSWCHEQGRIDANLCKGERPSEADHGKRIAALRSSLDEAKADLAASDELIAEVEREIEKPIPFHSLG